MDRLIALVALRWRLELRAAVGARSRLAALLVALPALGLLSLSAAFVAFSLARLLEAQRPELVLPALSAVAALVGLSWALAPLLAGVAATETHDLGRLLHYPVPLTTLVGSSLLANLLQPVVLAQLPPLLALSLGLAGVGARWPAALAGLLLALGLALAAGQCVGLALHALSRHRRWHDRALLAGIALGLGLSLLPLLLLSGAGRGARRLGYELLARDVSVLLPFSWGARAAVHGARGEALAFLSWAAGAALAIAATVAVSSVLAQRLYRGELDLGRGPQQRPAGPLAAAGRDRRAGREGAAHELARPAAEGARLHRGDRADARAGRAVAGHGRAGRARADAGPRLLRRDRSARRERVRQRAAGRLAAARLPGRPDRDPGGEEPGRDGCCACRPWCSWRSRRALVAGVSLLPAVLSIVLATQLIAAALDNFVSVLSPLPLPGAGRDPSTPVSGVRGLGAAAIAFVAMLGSLLLSAPFAFLAWLPHLLDMPWLWVLSLPLALAGAGGVYFMLASWAARLLTAREPELIARVSGDA